MAHNPDPKGFMCYTESPCHHCEAPVRYPGCHDRCEKPEYLNWKANREDMKRKREKALNCATQSYFNSRSQP